MALEEGFQAPTVLPCCCQASGSQQTNTGQLQTHSAPRRGALGSCWALSPSRWVAQGPCFRAQHSLPPVSPCCLQPPKQPTHMPSNLFHLKKCAHPRVLSHCFPLTESKEEGREEELTYQPLPGRGRCAGTFTDGLTRSLEQPGDAGLFLFTKEGMEASEEGHTARLGRGRVSDPEPSLSLPQWAAPKMLMVQQKQFQLIGLSS